jgi:organic hydroperoxide reductase OsmC/OhrA
LFVAAANSCLMTTFLAIAENFKLEFSHFESHAVGKLEIVDKKFMISEITLRPIVHVAVADQVEKAMKVLHKSESACLISNSIKSTIIFEPQVLLPDMLENEALVK